MNKQLVVFYLKRHVAGIVGLVLAIGFGVGGFMMKGKAKDAATQANTDYKAIVDRRVNLEKGQALGGSQAVKVESKNVDAANIEAEINQNFIKEASEVIQQDTINPMTNEEFMVYMANVIEELNQRAREALVQVQPDPTNATIRTPYNFTFMNLRAVPQLAKDKIPELQLQLRDIRAISDILFQSQVSSIESLQRTRVTHEDLMAGPSRDFLDTRPKYTNNISVVRPYKVRFQCLSGGIAKVLNGFAREKNFFVIRKMEVTQVGAAAPASGGLGGGMGGFPGMGGSPSAGGFPSAGSSLGEEGGELGSEEGGVPGGYPGVGTGAGATIAKPKKVLTPQHMAWLVQQGFATRKATNVISESVLEVELDLDVIRQRPSKRDPNEGVGPVPTGTPPGT